MLADDRPKLLIEVNNHIDNDILVYDYNGAEWETFFSVRMGDGSDPVPSWGEQLIKEALNE